MVEINKWIQDLDPMGSPHLKEEMIGGDCRSRSPLQKPSKRCKNHRRERRGSKLKKVNNGGERELKNVVLNLLKMEEGVFIGGGEKLAVWGNLRPTRREGRLDRKWSREFSVQKSANQEFPGGPEAFRCGENSRWSPEIPGAKPGAAEFRADFQKIQTKYISQKNCDNFCIRTPILANLDFLECSQQDLLGF